MKLKITRRDYNLRTRRREGWEAATECKRFVAVRLEEPGTPWELSDGGQKVGWFGSLKRCQRHIDRTAGKVGA